MKTTNFLREQLIEFNDIHEENIKAEANDLSEGRYQCIKVLLAFNIEVGINICERLDLLLKRGSSL